MYLNHLAGRLRAAGREEGGETAAPHLLEARDTFEKLAALMAAQPMYQQSLPQLHQNLTELCHELGDEQAVRMHSPACCPMRPCAWLGDCCVASCSMRAAQWLHASPAATI